MDGVIADHLRNMNESTHALQLKGRTLADEPHEANETAFGPVPT